MSDDFFQHAAIALGVNSSLHAMSFVQLVNPGITNYLSLLSLSQQLLTLCDDRAMISSSRADSLS